MPSAVIRSSGTQMENVRMEYEYFFGDVGIGEIAFSTRKRLLKDADRKCRAAGFRPHNMELRIVQIPLHED